MMEFLNFAFRNLWTFFGVVFLILMTGYAIQMALSGLRGLINIAITNKSYHNSDKEE